MATTTMDPVVQLRIRAIQFFSRAPDKKQHVDTNGWLQNFRHSVRICYNDAICFAADSYAFIFQAWTACNILLRV